jgi:hypothetical protein
LIAIPMGVTAVSEGILAAVLIFGIGMVAACFVVRHLKKTSGRVAVVISALAILVGALVPVIKILVESPAPTSGQVVAPAVPAAEVGTAGVPR